MYDANGQLRNYKTLAIFEGAPVYTEVSMALELTESNIHQIAEDFWMTVVEDMASLDRRFPTGPGLHYRRPGLNQGAQIGFLGDYLTLKGNDVNLVRKSIFEMGYRQL